MLFKRTFISDIRFWLSFQIFMARLCTIVARLWRDCGAIVARLWRDCGAILDNYGAVTKTQPILIFDLFLVKI